MTFKRTSGASNPDIPVARGLRGPDKQQDERRVQRTKGGSRKKSTKSSPGAGKGIPGTHRVAKDGQAFPGTHVRGLADHGDQGLPEGLRRERKGPLNPNSGRGEIPLHVPQWKPKPP